MKHLKSFTAGALLSSACTLGITHMFDTASNQVTPAAPRVELTEKTASPAQVEIAKEGIRQDQEETNLWRQGLLTNLHRQSLDGEGRIFYDADKAEIVIYKDTPAISLLDVKTVSDDSARWVIREASINRRASALNIENLSDQDLRTALKDYFLDRSAYTKSTLQRGDHVTTLNLETGRVCEEQRDAGKRDCFPVDKVNKDTRLGKDITFAQQRLGR